MKNFYLLYGTDKALIQIELDRIISKLNISDVVHYDMGESNLLDVIEDLSTVSLFSGKKIVVMDDCMFLGGNKSIDGLEALEEYIEHYNPNSYCILLSYVEKVDSRKRIVKLLNKNANVMELKGGNKENASKYIEDVIKENGYRIENSSYLVDRAGSNIYDLKNELDKLMMYCMESKYICNKDIDRVVVKNVEEEIFALTDAVIARDIVKSLTLLENFLNRSYDEMQIVMLLASQFRFLFQVKRLLNKNKSEGEIAKTLGCNPYRVKFTVKKLYSYSEDMILSYISKLAKIDHDVKLGIMDKRLALELFIIGNKDRFFVK